MRTQVSVRAAMLEALPQLRAFAIALCRNANEADDLVQDSLVRAYSNIGSFQPGTNLAAWLTTILRNQFYSERRRRRYRAVEPLENYTDALASPPVQTVAAEFAKLRSAMDRLRTQEREALLLTLACGYSYEEAGEICGCPAGTIKSRVHRARGKLAELLSINAPQEPAHDWVDFGYRPGQPAELR
jgi:RNA polymerase sigma-70 factor (ECF subfamily)